MPETSLAVPDGMTLSSWWELRRVPRSTAFKLVKIAGIEPGKVRMEGSRSPVSFLNAQQVGQLDALHQQMEQHGKSLAQLENALATVRRPEPSQAAAEPPAAPVGPAQSRDVLKRLQVGQLAIETGMPLSKAEIAWLIGARPGGDVVTRGRVTARRTGRTHWILEPAQDV
jgi:hypothetical protein